jgi:S1-C subfamily serine protease
MPPQATPKRAPRPKQTEEKIESKPKDWWDKFGAISGLLSAVVVALIGFYAANIYDQRARDSDRQQKDRAIIAEELQTVEKFLPDLTSENELKKKGALLAISSLGNTELAKKLADLSGGPGATAALTSIASSSQTNNEEKKIAQSGLEDLYNKYNNSIAVVSVTGIDPADDHFEDRGTGFVISKDGYVITAAHLFKNSAPDKTMVTLTFNQNVKLSSTLVKLDKDFDVALLKVNISNQPVTPLPLKPDFQLGVSQPITLVGFPESLDNLLVVAGRIIGLNGPNNMSMTDASAVPGMSGSPVFNQTGEVIGMVRGSVEGKITLFLPIRLAKPLLEIAGAQ